MMAGYEGMPLAARGSASIGNMFFGIFAIFVFA